MHARRGYVDLQVNGYAEVDFNADALSSGRRMWQKLVIVSMQMASRAFSPP
jgi:hypothetical protein